MNVIEKRELEHTIRHATTEVHRQLRGIETALDRLSIERGIVQLKGVAVLSSILKHPWHPTLLNVVKWIYKTWSDNQIVITEGYRTGGGVHSTNPLRAVDLRSWTFPNPEEIVEKINTAWDYGKEGYNVALYHRTSHVGAAYHFHIQVRDETKRRGE